MDASIVSARTVNAAVELPLAVSGDFETFLRMLTTQIQNQDPLSPMAADQFASQLASFSMVEQQSLTNQKIDSLGVALIDKNIATYSAVIGRMAYHEKPFLFSGSSITLEVGELGEIDEELKLSFLNSDGFVIAERSLLHGQDIVNWDGTDNIGRLVPVGSYTAELRRATDDTRMDVSVSTGNIVEEVRFGGAQAELLLSDGTTILETEVSKLR